MQRIGMGGFAAPPLLFILLVFPVLVLSALIVPPGEIPDEVAHIVRANSLLHGQLFGERRPSTDSAGNPAQDAGVIANPALLAAGFAFQPTVRPKAMTRQRWDELLATPWAPSTAWVSVPNTAVYFPIFYLPAAAGLGLAHAVGCGPFVAIYVARIANVIAFTALAIAALTLARWGRGGILAALALPMTVSVAGSCNQDGLLIATACLATALLTRPGATSLRLAAAALALVLATKPVYLPLAPLIGAVAWQRGEPVRSVLVITAATALPAIVWYLLVSHYTIVPFNQSAPYVAGPLWPGRPGQVFGTTNPAEQLRVFLRRPEALFGLPYQTMLHSELIWAREFVGVLGTLDLPLPQWLYSLWWWALAALGLAQFVRDRREPAAWPGWLSLLGLLLILASLVALLDGQYLSWTHVGAKRVEGVQGRYFIPLIPLLALALPKLALPLGAKLRAVLQAPLALAAAAALLTVPTLLVTAYYLR